MIYALIVYLCLGFLVFYKSKILIKDFNTDYLSKSNTDSIKAVCAIIIVFHHITNEISCGSFFFPFQFIGFLAVALFFFFSGYGLTFSLLNNSKYMSNFLKKRLTKICIPVGLATIIYVAYELFTSHSFNPIRLLTQFLGDSPIVRNSWFIIVIIYLYICFFFSFKIIKNQKAQWIVFYILLALWSFGMFMPHWSPTIIAFGLGVVFAKRKQVFDSFFRKNNILILLISLISFIVIMFVRMKSHGIIQGILSVFASVTFVLLIVCCLTKAKISNPILSFLSRISLEIYLYHGLIMLILNKSEFISSSPSIYIFLTLLFTLLLAWLMYLTKNCLFDRKKQKIKKIPLD